MAEQNGDVIAVLTYEHRQVKELFDVIERTPRSNLDERRRLADQAIIELVRHSVAEERFLYPAARAHVPGGDDLADRELAEHTEAENAMKELEQAPAADPRFDELLGQLVQDIRRHVDEEESELFPRLSQHMDSDTLLDLGRKVADVAKTAPTRPDSSESSEFTALIGSGAGLVNRAREALERSGQ